MSSAYSAHACTDIIPGVGLNLVLAPLAADLFYEVEALAEDNSEAFGKAGAYASAYSLLCCAMGLGIAIGPIIAGILVEKTGWQVTQYFLSAVCLLGSLGACLYTGRVARGKKKVRFQGISGAI